MHVIVESVPMCHCRKCADAVDRKLSKLVHACRSHSLPTLARFLRHSVEGCMKIRDFRPVSPFILETIQDMAWPGHILYRFRNKAPTDHNYNDRRIGTLMCNVKSREFSYTTKQ